MDFQFPYYLALFLFIFVWIGVAVRLVMLLLSLVWIRFEKRLITLSDDDTYSKVSLLIPAFNEENTIVESVTHAINVEYPELEIIVVNDGSKDNTLALLIEAFELSEVPVSRITESIPTQSVNKIFTSDAISHLIVIDKENGGKADALNCAINASTADYVLALDADTVLAKNTIKYLMRPFLQDDETVVTSGSVRIITDNNKPSLFDNLQKIEFVNSISLFRTGWNFLNANLIVSGALGLFKKKIMFEVGGYHNFAIGEDMELIVRIHRYLLEKGEPYKILQLALPTCFTSAVPGMKEMIKQRKRWQKGLLSSLRLNMSLFFNPRYKTVGLIAMPFYLFFEVLGPFTELLGLAFYVCLIMISETPLTPIFVWIAGLFFAICNNWLSISIDKFLLRGMAWKEYLKLLVFSSSDPFFYHFLQLYCKIKGTIEYFTTVQFSPVWSTRRNKQNK